MSSIVVIEDDKLLRELVVEWLRAEDYSVSAFESIDTGAPAKADLVIVDVYMPRGEGAKTLCAIKAAHPQTPLIAISGQFRAGLAGSCTTAAALGVDRVLAKPFTQREALAIVKGLIGPGVRGT
jgi:DNA-binding response OmpR family regulator